jgi:hypothetical protein
LGVRRRHPPIGHLVDLHASLIRHCSPRGSRPNRSVVL